MVARSVAHGGEEVCPHHSRRFECVSVFPYPAEERVHHISRGVVVRDEGTREVAQGIGVGAKQRFKRGGIAGLESYPQLKIAGCGRVVTDVYE